MAAMVGRVLALAQLNRESSYIAHFTLPISLANRLMRLYATVSESEWSRKSA